MQIPQIITTFFKWCSVLVASIGVYVSHKCRPLLKWLLRRTTGLCELQRICYCETAGAHRITGVERSLLGSRSDQIKRLVQFLDRAAAEKRFGTVGAHTIVDNAVLAVNQIKGIRPEVHQPFGKALGQCVSLIWGYSQLLADVEALRRTAYDSQDAEHERKLLELWQLLVPERRLESRISDGWKEVGFQGDDPATDFRGMGLLGLENLLFFARTYPAAAAHVLSHSRHPHYGYSFACVGINLTHMSHRMWTDGAAKSHVYNACHQSQAEVPDMSHFHRFYCHLFFEFDKLWLSEKPATIMDFSRVRDLFEARLRVVLADRSALLKINFTVDQI